MDNARWGDKEPDDKPELCKELIWAHSYSSVHADFSSLNPPITSK